MSGDGEKDKENGLVVSPRRMFGEPELEITIYPVDSWIKISLEKNLFPAIERGDMLPIGIVIHEVEDGLIILSRLPKYQYIYTPGGGGRWQHRLAEPYM